jgi:catechol 2,3-dioxygenase
MHLHVRNIPEADAFYRGVLGFDLMASLGSALFVSAGGYHHHLGANIWGTAGAPPPPPDAIGLRYFTILLPNNAEVGKVLDRVRGAGLAVADHEKGALIRDLSQNAFVLGLA